MIEEIITSGRMNPEIDPVLHVWGWEIPFYLFLGGISAGILIFSAYFTLRNRQDELPVAVKWMPIAVPFLIGIGLISLLLDLSHVLYAWQLFTNIRWESPMSWGAWTLMIITPLSIAWVAIWLEDIFPNWDWKFDEVKTIIEWLKAQRRILAQVLILLSIILGMYTGILLSAFNARPFWNTSILGPLFLTSGLSASAALISYFSKSEVEKRLFTRIDIILIGIELFMIIHLFMGHLAGTQVHIQAAQMFLGGAFTVQFWVFVVGLGLVLPVVLEILELKHKYIPAIVPVVLIVAGNLMLRFIVVNAGQASRWLY
ncbi:MAG: polysulfide reductase NrfD [Candidatus Marinimicrobia bacterium]|jgi:formate-dependent nitrite reductase membrane component NrfD|nr:polysulfide reductase NrfD [Candidatus Neomarinimicrobiota bacterium]MBT3632615.1 polysulfide reductase NrfD [Candidatus Neomarinimicrobiota bacterium]MBT3824507.1 polysulfide reductase NrfD [Candidatus Neomarinimicrobiota bacterium]MBT4129174.1 polysulfide reductase NrfD [Candidatus Neomarinimicrobiota bacterium]MBT4295195.1 polysulfide reductase NrfD [Candidatus Neomarinimicrobiota bacterium]